MNKLNQLIFYGVTFVFGKRSDVDLLILKKHLMKFPGKDELLVELSDSHFSEWITTFFPQAFCFCLVYIINLMDCPYLGSFHSLSLRTLFFKKPTRKACTWTCPSGGCSCLPSFPLSLIRRPCWGGRIYNNLKSLLWTKIL